MTAMTPGQVARAKYAAVDMPEDQRWEITAHAVIDWWFAERDLEPPQASPAGPKPAPELAAAMGETKAMRELLDQTTRAVLTKRWALTDSEKRIINGFRQQAGLDPSTREIAYAEDREADENTAEDA